MTLGEKIKKARKAKKISQAALTKNVITRNMLSRIENGSANPSLDTLRQLAEALNLPLPYLLSEDDDLFFFEKKAVIDSIYKAYFSKDYLYCINKIKQLSDIDDELAYLVATSAFALTKDCIKRGSLLSAIKYSSLAEQYAEKTVFDTAHIKALLPMYNAIAKNIQAPLLEFTPDLYTGSLITVFEYELYQYLIQNYSYAYKTPSLKSHVTAKEHIKARNYSEAIKALLDAVEKNRDSYDAYVQFSLYSDLELCYKHLYDFENAYTYSSKRMSMLEGFKS